MTGALGKKAFDSKTIFFLGLLLAASGIASPPVALVGGVAFGFLVEHPFRQESSSLARLLLQASVVALGFGMNLHQVLRAGGSGFLYTAISITCAIALGLLLGRLFRVGGKASFLITAGTAICGGSAIAAIAPISNASEEEISVSMGTIFLLNSIALLIFPAIGAAVHLSQNQFGLWAALAIHDTSSVVGAAAKYGNQALVVATTVKLARALWIVPLSLFTAAYIRRESGKEKSSPNSRVKVKMPWFILFFCAAALVSTCVPRFAPMYGALSHLGRAGLTATLFLIGTSLSKRTLRQVGFRPFAQGISLWLVITVISLWAIHSRWISI
ncbi:MAG TPA: putative sulfate exporter family transporter [Acidobacteriaceae bacterium]|jgi:uncharacterized integral membrane protein (TIGR00698 family)|nr:putative sulfate exporter family transporter [Acidobacteriaceae bacterium]